MVELAMEYFIIMLILIFFMPVINVIQTIWKLFVHFFPIKIDLKTKYGDWAVITGSTDGIGKEYAKELAKRNINIVLISRNLEKLNKTKNEIEAINPSINIKIIQADFSKGRDVFENIKNQLCDIPVGILVNNVGTLTATLDYFGILSESDSWDMIAINAGATTLMTHMIIEQMKKRKRGAIVNVSSGSELLPLPLQAVYAATKIFVRYLSDALRLEYADSQITVQCLSPFYINTKMINFSPVFQNHGYLFPDADIYAKSAIKTLGRLDTTTGYWIHELFTLVVTLAPISVRSWIAKYINRYIRYQHIKHHNKL